MTLTLKVIALPAATEVPVVGEVMEKVGKGNSGAEKLDGVRVGHRVVEHDEICGPSSACRGFEDDADLAALSGV